MTWTSPFTYSTGQVVTAANLNTYISSNSLALVDRLQEVRKASDENRISTTTLAADGALAFTVVAGQTYNFELALIFNSANSAIDAKVGFSFPSGTMSFMAVTMDPAVASGTIGSGIWTAVSAATSGTSALACGVASADTGVLVKGSFLCTVGGTVTLMWAQNTSTASNMTLKAGSTISAKRVTI